MHYTYLGLGIRSDRTIGRTLYADLALALSGCKVTFGPGRGSSRPCFIGPADISWNGTGNEACAAAERHVLKSPLYEDEDTILKLNEVHQVHEQPDKPSWKTRNM